MSQFCNPRQKKVEKENNRQKLERDGRDKNTEETVDTNSPEQKMKTMTTQNKGLMIAPWGSMKRAPSTGWPFTEPRQKEDKKPSHTRVQ